MDRAGQPLVIDRRPPSQFLAEEGQLRVLEREGEAGQEAGVPGMGREPLLEHAPGGRLLSSIQHPAFTTLEQFFRTAPEQSWFSVQVSPSRPIKFELGSFLVPDNTTLLVTDYLFGALRQSGADPADFVLAAPYRFSGYLGFDISVNGTRLSNLFYQLDPAPAQFFRDTGAAGARATTAQFNRARANAFGATAGEGASLLPPRPQVQGARGMPFTMFASSGARVSLKCVIFRRVMAPLAGIQGSVGGYLIPQTVMSSLMQRVRPR
jgi:hypothetical protein